MEQVSSDLGCRVVFQHTQHRCYVLTAQYQDWPAGTLLYRGGCEDGEGYEYFNMTKEIETKGDVIESKHNLPYTCLRVADKDEATRVQNWFDFQNMTGPWKELFGTVKI